MAGDESRMQVGKGSEGISAVWQSYASFSQSCVKTGGANAQVNLSIAAVPGHFNCLSGIAWSYDDIPTGGRLWVTVGVDTVFDLDITQGGPGFIPFVPPLEITGRVIIHLAAGGVGISGKLSLLGRWTRSRR